MCLEGGGSQKPWCGKLNLKFLSRKAGNQEQYSGFIMRGIRFAMDFLMFSVVIIPVMILRELGFKLQSFIMMLLTISI